MKSEEKMKNAPKRDVIQETLDKFDFGRVHEYMKSVDWQYFYGPPSLGDLISTARSVLKQVLNSKDRSHGSVSTGGFHARVDKWESDIAYLSLSFIPFKTETALEEGE
jgi:hypothetical protein